MAERIVVRSGRPNAPKKPMKLKTQLIIIGCVAFAGLLYWLIIHPIMTGQNEVQTIQLEDLKKELRQYGLGFSPTVKSFEGERFTRANPVYSAHIVTDEDSIKRLQADSKFQVIPAKRATKNLEELATYYKFENDEKAELPKGGMLMMKKFGKPEANTFYIYLVRKEQEIHLYLCLITAPQG